ncbi:MAG: hypothetical protein FJY37_07525 [Betaproteobacteria bacterium]|nr:hypothetical protein [Betaproteobacteria bacterium]
MAAANPALSRREVKEIAFAWEGRDKSGKMVKGEIKATGEAVVQSTLRRQGINVTRIKKARRGIGGKVTDKEVTLFTRQLATMMKAGVPLLQAFDIVRKGHANPAVGKLLMDIKADVETGSSLNQAFRKYPVHFDALFCNLVGAGEAAPRRRKERRSSGNSGCGWASSILSCMKISSLYRWNGPRRGRRVH